jgi:SpoVK/Ycf46/Vps4 family AAA+-type ATPase
MTAAALHFFVSYRKLLQQDVNKHLAQTYDLKRPNFAWSDVVDAQINVPFKERITTRIYEDFITPFRETGRSDRSAMILHGPPGTAKTTLAEAIATELKWDLITVTPSDFVKEGLENSEKSARLLFKHLMQLRDAVVLFDEIDEMLRDRQNDQSQSGVAMLRFIVPGMLPKLQSLKQYAEKNSLIFIVSTNYVDRLDAAITRTGRIDERYAVVPPDLQARYCLIKKFIEDENKKKRIPLSATLSPGTKLSRRGIDRGKKTKGESVVDLAGFLASKTNGWVVKELQLLVTSFAAPGIDSDWKKKIKPLRITPEFEKLLISKGLDRNAQTKLLPNKILDRGPSLDLFRFYQDRKSSKPELKRVLPSYGFDLDPDPESDTGTVTDQAAKVIVELDKNGT